MSLAAKISALMETLKQADVDTLRPAERERFAFLCSRWCAIARAREHKSGVLAELQETRGRQ